MLENTASNSTDSAPSSRPTPSVGLPVYNGQKWIEEAIGSILKQSFTDFELIIADNASTDITGAIRSSAAALRHQVYRRLMRSMRSPDECPFPQTRKEADLPE
ncbi:MAG: glycosyltransferase family 2 protein [Gammaproteobacteria bacterium]|nr:glycosyltransferase family 2 protein [Gammaproteobacteria bacterium]